MMATVPHEMTETKKLYRRMRRIEQGMLLSSGSDRMYRLREEVSTTYRPRGYRVSVSVHSGISQGVTRSSIIIYDVWSISHDRS